MLHFVHQRPYISLSLVIKYFTFKEKTFRNYKACSFGLIYATINMFVIAIMGTEALTPSSLFRLQIEKEHHSPRSEARESALDIKVERF